MDTHFIMYRWICIIIITVTHCKQSYFCVSPRSAATLFRWGGRFWNFLMWNFSRILHTENY